MAYFSRAFSRLGTFLQSFPMEWRNLLYVCPCVTFGEITSGSIEHSRFALQTLRCAPWCGIQFFLFRLLSVLSLPDECNKSRKMSICRKYEREWKFPEIRRLKDVSKCVLEALLMFLRSRDRVGLASFFDFLSKNPRKFRFFTKFVNLDCLCTFTLLSS